MPEHSHIETEKDRVFVTALARGLKLLEAFHQGESALSNQEFANRTGLAKSTVSRLTYTLTQLGYLEYQQETGLYHFGPAALSLGAKTLASYDIRQVAAPLMKAFANTYKVSVSLAIQDGSDMVYLETCRSQAKVSVQLMVGSRVPIATTAIGRAFYAGLTEEDRTRLDHILADRYQADWPTIRQNLMQTLNDYHRNHFSQSFGEFEQEVMAVGVFIPPITPSQRVMSLNASGPAFAFTAQTMQNDIAPALLALRQHIAPYADY